MAVYSMTGYASAQRNPASHPGEGDAGAGQIGMEIRSVNGRFLDLALRLPDEVRSIEPALREKLAQRLKRGKVELRLTLESRNELGIAEPAPKLLQRLNAVQDKITAWLPGAPALSVAEVMQIAAREAQPAQHEPAQALALADQLIDALMQARAREGAKLAAMLTDRIRQLRGWCDRAEPLIPQLVTQQRQRFLDRWAQAMELSEQALQPEVALERALTEATAFAIRIDVAEELTRLRSHLDELERLIRQGGDIGKRLDFLIQELHREANTLGSKSAALELTRISVDMKVLIEQMREQVQNIE